MDEWMERRISVNGVKQSGQPLLPPSLPSSSSPLVHPHVIGGLGVGPLEGAARGHRQEGSKGQETHAPPPPDAGHGQEAH